jgi:2-dehydro-3-deoxyphosphogluconate aldolase/(4S)-4-hydroxy-2-oxoglutarate aldolase
MTNTNFSLELFTKLPVIGIMRHLSFEDIKAILPIYKEQGLNTVEITMNTQNAGQIIRYAVKNYGKDLNIGAGTVCNLLDLNIALDAGASFIVTPVINSSVIEECIQERIQVIPGAFTPTEVFRAMTLGAEIVKVFPAGTLGPQYIRDIKAPFGQVKLLPTGGININNCIQFMKAGAFGLGIGSQLFSTDLINGKEWKALANHFSSFTSKINEFNLR